MLLYVICFEDRTHLKIGVCKDMFRINFLNEVYNFNFHKSIVIQSTDNQLLKLIEKNLLNATKKYAVENLELKDRRSVQAGKSEVRLVEALEIIEDVLNFNYKFYKKLLEINRFALIRCKHCKNFEWIFDTVNLKSLPWKSDNPIIRSYKKNRSKS
jgi:hypothetical protein